MDTSFIVLAGGKSRRLGRDKLSVRIGNTSLFQRVLETLIIFHSEIIIVKSSDSYLNYDTSLPMVIETDDLFYRKGPIGGIYSGLNISKSRHNFVVAGDMPFLNVGLISKTIELAHCFDLYMPRIGSYYEPLHAVYSKSCIDPIERLITAGEYSMLKLIPMVNTGFLGRETIDMYDSKLRCFTNINTEADLHSAQELLVPAEQCLKRWV